MFSPTPAGVNFYGRNKAALADIESARAEAAAGGAEVAGHLRLGAATLFAPTYVMPAVGAFMERHPAVSVELVAADEFQDPVAEGLDLVVRIGDLADSSLTARRIAGLRRVTVAAPGYLSRHGRPTRPGDLKDHACIVRTLAQAPLRWSLSARRP